MSFAYKENLFSIQGNFYKILQKENFIKIIKFFTIKIKLEENFKLIVYKKLFKKFTKFDKMNKFLIDC